MAHTIEHTDLAIDGMTCASCVRRVERSLAGDDPGVAATVNLATGIARVEHDGTLTAEELTQRVERAGYGARPIVAHPGHDRDGHEHGATHAHAHDHGVDTSIRRRLLVAIPLTLPIVLAMFIPALRFDGWELAALVLGTPVALWCAWPFHRIALKGARHRTSTMDTLVSIGVLAAWGWSVASVAMGSGESYVEVAAVTTTFVLAGRLAEQRARTRAGDALRTLLDTAGREVTLLEDGGDERLVQASELQVGDRFLVRPGELVATDGVVESGESSVDRALVTGESLPEPVADGDEVLGGTQNVDGRLVVRATRVGSETAVAQVARLVTEAQAGRARVQRLADAVSAVFVPIVLVIAALTLTGWLAFDIGTSADAVSAAVAVLIVACPCALGLATPTALLVGSGRGAQMGIVIRGPEVLEQARRIDTIVLDKTGTITGGTFTLTGIDLGAGVERGEALRIAGALEAGSEHPIATAIALAARHELGGDERLPDSIGFKNHAGRGVTALVAGKAAAIGSARLLEELGIDVPADLLGAREAGATTVLVAWGGQARAALHLRDEPRSDSAAAIAALRALDLDVVVATGDGPDAAHAIGEAVGVADVRASLLPADKDALVQQLQAEGRRVAMVGDGINDSPALARADLGIAIGTGADVAIEASDLTLVSPSLWAAVDAIRLSRATLGRIRRNLFWAFAYNVAAIPLAVAGLLEPMVAGAAMAASSVFVVGGSLLLRRFRPSPR